MPLPHTQITAQCAENRGSARIAETRITETAESTQTPDFPKTVLNGGTPENYSELNSRLLVILV